MTKTPSYLDEGVVDVAKKALHAFLIGSKSMQAQKLLRKVAQKKMSEKETRAALAKAKRLGKEVEGHQKKAGMQPSQSAGYKEPTPKTKTRKSKKGPDYWRTSGGGHKVGFEGKPPTGLAVAGNPVVVAALRSDKRVTKGVWKDDKRTTKGVWRPSKR